MQKEQQSTDVNKIRIEIPAQAYPGVCNLCNLEQHPTIDCPFSIFLYHATNIQSLKSIVKFGFNAKTGRLGKALYCSDQQTMCVRYVLKNMHKFKQPVLMKVKVMLTDIKNAQNAQEAKKILQQHRQKKQLIECIKCPYFKIGDQIQYEYALYDAQYAIVGWSRINLPASLQKKYQKKEPILYPITVSCPIKCQDTVQKNQKSKSSINEKNKKCSNCSMPIGQNNQKSPVLETVKSKNYQKMDEQEESSVKQNQTLQIVKITTPNQPIQKIFTSQKQQKEQKDKHIQKTKIIKKNIEIKHPTQLKPIKTPTRKKDKFRQLPHPTYIDS